MSAAKIAFEPTHTFVVHGKAGIDGYPEGELHMIMVGSSQIGPTMVVLYKSKGLSEDRKSQVEARLSGAVSHALAKNISDKTVGNILSGVVLELDPKTPEFPPHEWMKRQEIQEVDVKSRAIYATILGLIKQHFLNEKAKHACLKQLGLETSVITKLEKCQTASPFLM